MFLAVHSSICLSSLACWKKKSKHLHLLLSRAQAVSCAQVIYPVHALEAGEGQEKEKTTSTSVLIGLKASPFKPAEQLYD